MSDLPPDLAQRFTQAMAAQEQVPSPCISVCRMAPDTGLCVGCLRKLEEIAGWSRMDDAGKRVVWQRIAQRAGLPVGEPT